MRFVLDTNLLVSALINPFGTPADIIKLVPHGKLTACFDLRMLIEYRDVLSRPKFNFTQTQINFLIGSLVGSGKSVDTLPLAHSLPDPDDTVFLEVAIAGKVDFLVTGNIKDYPERLRAGINVVSPKEFIDLYRKTL